MFLETQSVQLKSEHLSLYPPESRASALPSEAVYVETQYSRKKGWVDVTWLAIGEKGGGF